MTPSVDKFLVLTTVSDRVLADQICEVLEASEIPVLLEHVELFHEDEVASGVRILVPAHHAQQAPQRQKNRRCPPACHGGADLGPLVDEPQV